MGINSSFRATEPTLPCFIAQKNTGDSLGCRWWPAGGVKALSSALAQADLEPISKQKSFAYSFPQPASSWTYTNSPWQWLGAVLLLGTQPGPALCLASCLFSYLWRPPSCSSCFLKHMALLLPPLPPRNHDKHLQEVSVRQLRATPLHLLPHKHSPQHLCSLAAPVPSWGTVGKTSLSNTVLQALRLFLGLGPFRDAVSSKLRAKVCLTGGQLARAQAVRQASTTTAGLERAIWRTG